MLESWIESKGIERRTVKSQPTPDGSAARPFALRRFDLLRTTGPEAQGSRLAAHHANGYGGRPPLHGCRDFGESSTSDSASSSSCSDESLSRAAARARRRMGECKTGM